METKTCNDCGETFPRTTKYFHKSGKKYKDGSPKLRGRCRTCRNARKSEQEDTPERKAYNNKRNQKFRDENPDYYKGWWATKRLAEGKEVGVLAPKKNFYIGYVVLESGTYFKPGITSHDSMEERYRKVPVSYGKVIGVQQTDFFRFDTEDDARAMEREFLSHCRTFMGEPTMGREWWEV